MAVKLRETSADASTDELVSRLEEDGYLIFPSLLSSAEIDAVREAMRPHLCGEYPGRNDFEGYKSERVYAMLAKSPVFADLVAHPLMLGLCEAVLGPNVLLSACLGINTHPGETAQALHFDDAFYDVPRPRRALSLGAFWAIDEFTDTNGATEIIPGSHRWSDEGPPREEFEQAFETGGTGVEQSHPDLTPVVMPAGSLMVGLGTMWHRGGPNRSDASRLAITPQYCVAWGRQQENMTLSVPPQIAATYSERVRELIGYSIHPPFMGHVGGRHPAKTLPERD